MARPSKCRKICQFPQNLEFIPAEEQTQLEPVILSLDEYETIRLIDYEGLNQEQCSGYMEIARTSVQRIYESARKKLAQCVVEGRALRIYGGDVRLCDGQNVRCGERNCLLPTISRRYQKEKGDHAMRVAVTYENGQVFQHFGHTEFFKVYEISDGEIVSSQVVDTNGSGHGALAGVLQALQVDVLICGGIGGGAQAALTAAGIRWFGGVSGDADEAAKAFAAGTLQFDPDARCNHHDHGAGHTCGDHGCGSHTCGHHGA